MRILVSNDDGIHAPGIQALEQALMAIGEVVVVAPDRNCSGASNALTLSHPLRVTCLDNNHYSVEGTPTDCVHLAVTGMLERPIDMVVSGINRGANLGDDIIYSGTVAAAIEGRNLGLPAVAVSLVGDNPQYLNHAAALARQLIYKILTVKLPANTILNINIPDLEPLKIQGFRITRLGVRHAAGPIIKTRDPRDRPIYWIGKPGSASDDSDGTDFHAIKHGFVSITPLNLDMTYYSIFDQLSSWIQSTPLQFEFTE